MTQHIFDYAPEGVTKFLSVEANNDGSAKIRDHSIGGGLASIDLPAEEAAELGRKLLALAGAS